MKKCYGLLLVGIFTMGTYLLVVYTSTDPPVPQVRVSQHRVRLTKSKASSWRSSPLTLDGYNNIVDNQPLRMHCNSCSLVMSSGHLWGSKRAEEIDRADCVIRMNDAPTEGYETDVGRRTSLRVVAHSSLDQLLRNRNRLLRPGQDSVYVFWGPSSLMNQQGLSYKKLRNIKKASPQLKMYTVSQQKMQQLDRLFKDETGMDRRMSQSWLSTGWFTMVLAIELCNRIDVYGMASPDFCQSPNQPVSYHYYGFSRVSECAMYLTHEHGERGGHHRFITEKLVFADWARTFDIHFHQPDWTPVLPAQNGTTSPVTLTGS
ncbi:alpha-N-acetylgalactosaminide alpha-2,6-sialyltransferase 5-like [Sardina pilchardus]|uniref:alpha-N-acetylgalactosaminide alpha-2,6-sialyltransferase 5-like n=1 Tax=Sardina pilchardus TaxID=27697 RepID=UPI002E11936E